MYLPEFLSISWFYLKHKKTIIRQICRWCPKSAFYVKPRKQDTLCFVSSGAVWFSVEEGSDFSYKSTVSFFLLPKTSWTWLSHEIFFSLPCLFIVGAVNFPLLLPPFSSLHFVLSFFCAEGWVVLPQCKQIYYAEALCLDKDPFLTKCFVSKKNIHFPGHC